MQLFKINLNYAQIYVLHNYIMFQVIFKILPLFNICTLYWHTFKTEHLRPLSLLEIDIIKMKQNLILSYPWFENPFSIIRVS